MKSVLLMAVAITVSLTASAQGGGDKSKRPSPPVQAKETLAGGTVVTIDYSQPSLKGRTIGKDVEPNPGQVWRAGANEATVFEISKPVRVQGKELPAGKYGFFTIDNGDEWTIIFNKTFNQWGAYEYKAADDVLRVNAKAGKASPVAEKLTYSIGKDGKVTLSWGDKQVSFKIDG